METPTRPNLIVRIFFSSTERRLRAGWRLVAQSVVMLMIGLLVAVPTFAIAFFFDIDNELLLSQVIALVSITLSVFLSRRFFDKRSIVSLGLRLDQQALADVAAGLVMSFLMIGLLSLLMWSAGWLGPEGFGWRVTANAAPQVMLWLVIFIIVGWNEELLIRGYYLQNLRDGLNLLWAVLLSSVIFGIAHILNPNASWVAAANIALAGVFFAFAWWRTQSLWLPIGLHIGWNFTLGVVFGFPVSGMPTYRLGSPTITGPEVWTGGAFGPEAGLVLLPVLLFGALLVYGYTHREKYPFFE